MLEFDKIMVWYEENFLKFKDSWDNHYENIRKIIIATINKKDNRNLSIDATGISLTDLKEGCFPTSLFEMLGNKIENFHLNDISTKNLNECKSCLDESGITQVHFHYSEFDMTFGVAGIVEEYVKKNIQDVKSFASFSAFLDDLEVIVKREYLKEYAETGNKYDLGLSLGIHSATMVPSLIKIFNHILSFIEKPSKEYFKFESRTYSFLREYNNAFHSAYIKWWFKNEARDGNAEYIVFCDYDKIFYSQGKQADKHRTYLLQDLLKIESDEFVLMDKGDWEWHDDDDHFHHVKAVVIKKK